MTTSDTQPNPDSIDFSRAVIASGVELLSMSVPARNGETTPALAYRFAKPDGSGEFYPPVILVLPIDRFDELGPLTQAAADLAVTGA